MQLTTTLEQRLLRDVVRDPSGCWRLTHAPGQRYPTIWVDGRSLSAHRLAYELWVGPIPTGMCVCHRCDVPRCINPAHLFLATNAENTADRHRKGRSARGERHGCAKLTAAQVFTIRILGATTTRPALAREFGVSLRTIYNVLSNEFWKENN